LKVWIGYRRKDEEPSFSTELEESDFLAEIASTKTSKDFLSFLDNL